MVIGVVVAALETGVVVVGNRASGPLGLAVVMTSLVAANKWTQNVARSQRRRQAQVDENISPSIMQM